MPQRLLVDADVLASRTPYRWLALLRAETDGAFELHSTSGLVAESVRMWTAQDPARREASSQRRHDLLVASLDEVLDTSGDATPDPLRAATADRAHVLLSSRVGEVGDEHELPFEVYTVDEFLCLLDDTAAMHVRSVIPRGGPDGGGVSFAEALSAAGCPAFAERVSRHLRPRAH